MITLVDKSAPLIEEGTFDARLQGITGLEQQARPDYQGQPRPPEFQIKFTFEIPSVRRTDGSSHTISKSINCVNSGRGNLLKVVSHLLQKSVTTAQLQELWSDEKNIIGLLGRPISLQVKYFDASEGKIAFIEGFATLDPRIDTAAAERPTYYFDPTVLDLETWALLPFYTKKQVMKALTADTFPKELHIQWTKDQEEEKIKQAQGGAGAAVSNIDTNSTEMGSIQ